MSENSSNQMEDEPSTESDFESDHRGRRPLKRRKLNQRESRRASTHDDIKDDGASAISAHQSPNKDKDNDDPEEPKAKKPKYRIHIPNNASMPEDAFFTQPPSRSPSPYRIDRFCWQKPKRPPSATLSRNKIHQPIEKSPTYPHPTDQSKAASKAKDAVWHQTQRVSAPEAHSGMTAPDAEAKRQHLAPLTSNKSDEGYDNVLDDLPSDAFSSPDPPSTSQLNEPILISSQDISTQQRPSQLLPNQRIMAPLANLRQTTLFGDQTLESGTQTQSVRKRNWPPANREEPPTHHKLDRAAMETWVYPTNLGKIRDYQYSIVAGGYTAICW